MLLGVAQPKELGVLRQATDASARTPAGFLLTRRPTRPDSGLAKVKHRSSRDVRPSVRPSVKGAGRSEDHRRGAERGGQAKQAEWNPDAGYTQKQKQTSQLQVRQQQQQWQLMQPKHESGEYVDAAASSPCQSGVVERCEFGQAARVTV
ncbi:uncharacterized protein PSANT_01383 [Moesziomyces antarcticus]|uniref:Uncharacterized protein n=1 Tax=Pseudozyma antarctica TaxID=84753 RepID=A0A5C3FH48_PSEA2|nr:uncharacterized protein PSANT_01383 [Moesziomyces antarcticus]